MPRQPEPTQAQLLLAVRQLWRPHWPGFPHDPQACIDHPVYGKCVRGQAFTLGRAPMQARPVPQLGTLHTAPPTPPGLPARTAGRWQLPPDAFDARRAAANDRDD